MRERTAGAYQASAYFAANLLLDVPSNIMGGLAWTLIVYLTIPLRMELSAVLRYFIVLVLICDIYTAMGHLAVIISPTIEQAFGILLSFVGAQVTLCGQVYLPETPFIEWLHHMMPSRYALSALKLNEFSGNADYPLDGMLILDQSRRLLDEDQRPIPISYMLTALVLFWVLTRLFVYLGLRYIRLSKR